MAKSKKQSQKDLINMISMGVLVIGIIATVLLALKSFKFSENSDYLLVSGIDVAFGKKLSSINKLNFNFLMVIALVLPVAAGVVQLLVKGRIGSISSVVLFAIALILIFTAKANHEVTLIVTSKTTVALKLTTIGIFAVVLNAIGLLGSAYKLSLE